VNALRNKEYCVAFGAHIRRLRQEKGITMRAFALDMGVEHSQLSKIERGINNPTISTVLAISETLKIPMKELFDFKFPQKKK
jgi:transcriptional regulator with XRE-family HTH domain